MSEQDRIAFEKFMSNKGYAVSYVGDGQYEFSSTQLNWEIWQAATAEANKRIDALESEVANLHLNIKAQEQLGYELQAHINNLVKVLRLARQKLMLNSRGFVYSNLFVDINEALKPTPAESLQAHDNEVLERAAKVAVDMPMKVDEIHEYRASDDCKAIAWDIYHAIRNLKDTK